MSCASGIYTVFTGSIAVPVGGFLPVGTTVRRYGKNLGQSGDGILVDGAGYYMIDTEVILTGTGAGIVTLQLTSDAEIIQGGTSSVTVTGGNVYTIPVHALIRKKCCDDPTTIQVKLANLAATVNQVSTIILKV